MLRSAPFNLGNLELIRARVAAINDISSSPVSTEGETVMPVADVVPDPPTDLAAETKM